MLRRDFRHSLRNPMMTLSGVGLPVIFLLLFVGVSLRAGLGSAIPIGGGYVDYLIPGILVMTAASCAEMTAIEMCTDKTEGIITRFRAMAITRASVLTGRVAGSAIRTLASGGLLVAVGLAALATTGGAERSAGRQSHDCVAFGLRPRGAQRWPGDGLPFLLLRQAPGVGQAEVDPLGQLPLGTDVVRSHP